MATEQVSFPVTPGLPLPLPLPSGNAAPPTPAPEVSPQVESLPVPEAEDRQRDPRPAEPRIDERHLEALGKMMEGLGDRLEFGVLEQSGQLFVKIVDRQTNQVVRFRPAQEFLELKEKLSAAVGLLVDERG